MYSESDDTYRQMNHPNLVMMLLRKEPEEMLIGIPKIIQAQGYSNTLII